MNSSVNVAVEPTARPSAVPPHLTSWYAQGRSDGLGDRLLMFDNATSSSFELLRFRPELAAAPGFEQALRTRVSRLETFRHPAFATVLGVEHLEGGQGLTLVSAHIAGKRLSEMIQAPRLVGLHPAFATWLIQQLTPALADLQRQGGDIAHGALNPDRVLLTPDGSFIMVEHVLGAALERLRLPQHLLWREFGIASPPSSIRLARLDGRADVIQLALIAVSILLGRRVMSSEYPDNLQSLLDESTGGIGQRSQSILPLRRWLERAFGLGVEPFRSADEARLGLPELPGYAPQPALGGQASASRSSTPGGPEPEDTKMKTLAVHLVGSRTSGSFGQSESRPVGLESPSTLTSAPALTGRQRTDDLPAPNGGVRVNDDLPGAKRPALRAKNGSGLVRALALGIGLLALGEAAAIRYLLLTRQVVTPVARIPVTIDSPLGGDIVVVDGRQVGMTPLNLTVGTDVHSIRIVTHDTQPPTGFGPPQAAEKGAEPAAPVDGKTMAALAVAAARQRSGGLRLSSPIELKVLEGERVLGSSADGPIVTTAGVHELDLINTALGYRSRRTVTVKAGQIVSLSVAPPDGRVSINASPWAQVWIDGKALGDTPIANISAAVGEHDITFRHPQLGEKRETVVVRSDALTRVSASFGR